MCLVIQYKFCFRSWWHEKQLFNRWTNFELKVLIKRIGMVWDNIFTYTHTHTHIHTPHTAQYVGMIASGVILVVVLTVAVVFVCVGLHMRKKQKVMQISRDWLGHFKLSRRCITIHTLLLYTQSDNNSTIYLPAFHNCANYYMSFWTHTINTAFILS